MGGSERSGKLIDRNSNKTIFFFFVEKGVGWWEKELITYIKTRTEIN
jgi:hypothetical protein